MVKKLEKEYLALVDTLESLQKPFNLLVAMNDLGVLYYRWGKFDQAKVWYEKSLELTEKLYGKEHVEFAITSSNLGWVHIKLGNLDKAEKYFKDCLRIRTQKIPQSFKTAESHSDLAWLYSLKEKPAESETSYRSAFDLLNRQFEKAFAYTSEQEKAQFIERLTDQVEGYYTLLHRFPDQVDPSLALDIALRWKSAALQSARELKRIVAEQRDTALSAKYEALTQARSVLAEVYLGRRQEQPGLAARAEALERDLAQIPAFRDALPQFSVSTEAVQSALQPSEALVEFVSYPLYNNQACKCGDSLWYGALVLRPEWPKPRFLPLFEEQALGGLLGDTIQRTIDIVQQLYPAKARGSVPANASEPVDLHALIWKPLDTLLSGVDALWLSSAGLLNRLNLGAVANERGEIAGQRYQIRQVVSARAILQERELTSATPTTAPLSVGSGQKRKRKPQPVTEKEKEQAVLFGALRYDADNKMITAISPPVAADTAAIFRSISQTKLQVSGWDTLKYARQELREIQQVLARQTYDASVFTDDQGTEEQYYQACTTHRPRVLHLATHGYFFPSPRRQRQDKILGLSFEKAKNPLLRSGLVLSGVNTFWTTGKVLPGKQDGVLTAYEIAQQDLRETELVVLSACSSGLGDINSSEGVAGLQRAFFKAGARYIIMTLWDVNDKAAQKFMAQFYTNWLEHKMAIPEAFRLTQQEMKEEYEIPYYWAGFVLVRQ